MHLTSSVPLLGLLSAIPLVLSIPTQIPHTLTRRDQFDGQPANLIITTYNAANCPTGTGQNTSITYGKQVLANTWSYTLNRDVQDGEQLDFSVYTPGQGNINGVSTACTQFAETTSPDPKTNGNLLADTCYGIGNEANCLEFSHPGTTSTPAPPSSPVPPSPPSPSPSPSAGPDADSCDVSYKFFFDEFQIRGKNFDASKIDTDGSGLEKQIKGCGDLTKWNFQMTPKDPAYQWHASGRLPIGVKDCVGRAVISGGGATIADCHGPG